MIRKENGDNPIEELHKYVIFFINKFTYLVFHDSALQINSRKRFFSFRIKHRTGFMTIFAIALD